MGCIAFPALSPHFYPQHFHLVCLVAGESDYPRVVGPLSWVYIWFNRSIASVTAAGRSLRCVTLVSWTQVAVSAIYPKSAPCDISIGMDLAEGHELLCWA